jgi:hypothetical protein
MAKSALTVSLEFKTRLRSLEFTRKKISTLFSRGLITRRDVEQIHQGLFLEAVAAFERFLEDLFLGLLTRQVNPSSLDTVPSVFFSSRAIAMPIVFNGPYYDWLPYDRMVKRAGHFFKDGHPFTVLDLNDKNKIDSFLIIRNVIAHKSAFAKKRFEDKVIGSTSLSPRERKVGGYLVGSFRSSPLQTRYENLIIEMATIFEKICTA